MKSYGIIFKRFQLVDFWTPIDVSHAAFHELCFFGMLVVDVSELYILGTYYMIYGREQIPAPKLPGMEHRQP